MFMIKHLASFGPAWRCGSLNWSVPRRRRAADSVLDHGAKAIELEDIHRAAATGLQRSRFGAAYREAVSDHVKT
jgi:hypothetical protein